MEHTVGYHESLDRSLATADFFGSVVNPKLIKYIGNNTLRKVKSDKDESIKIAKSWLDNWADLSPYTVVDQLKSSVENDYSEIWFLLKTKNCLKQ